MVDLSWGARVAQEGSACSVHEASLQSLSWVRGASGCPKTNLSGNRAVPHLCSACEQDVEAGSMLALAENERVW